LGRCRRGPAFSNEVREIVPKQQDSARPTHHERIDRRQQRRDPGTRLDWETIVLRRMAGHVKSLSDEAKDVTTVVDGGWEAAALRTLQRRLRVLESE
jgi:hypothetical protein